MFIHVYSCCNLRELQDLVVFTGKVDGRYCIEIQVSPFNVLKSYWLAFFWPVEKNILVYVPAQEYSPSHTCSIVDSKQT